MIPVIAVTVPILIITVMIFSSVKQVPPGAVFIMERLGSFHCVYTEGVHFAMPFLDRIAAKVNVTPQCLPLESVTALSSDDRPLLISAEIHFFIADAAAFFYSTGNAVQDLGRLTLTGLRDIIGSMDGGTALSSREETEKKLTRVIAPAVEQWGLAVSDIRLTELSSNQ